MTVLALTISLGSDAALLAEREWLDDATKTIGQFWKRKNARRNGLTTYNQADVSIIV